MELQQRGRMDGNRRDPRSKQNLPTSNHSNGDHVLTNGSSRTPNMAPNSQLSLADPTKFQGNDIFFQDKRNMYLKHCSFAGDFPTFQMPKYVGSFSLNEKREYLNDRSQLRYLAIPPSATLLHDRTWQVDFDLKNGVTYAIEKDEKEIRRRMLDDMLQWIVGTSLFFPSNPPY